MYIPTSVQNLGGIMHALHEFLINVALHLNVKASCMFISQLQILNKEHD